MFQFHRTRMSTESVKSVVQKTKHWSGEVESELRCRVLFGASHTHTSGGKGKREETRTAGHNQHRGNKRKDNEGRKRAREQTTSRQNKGRKTLEGGGESTQEPNPGTQKSKQRKAEQATKQRTTLSCRDFLHCFVIHTRRPEAMSHGYQVPS